METSKEKNLSVNDVPYQAQKRAFAVAHQATYVFDLRYDMNGLFSFMYQNDKNFGIRLTEKRKLFINGNW